MTEADIDRTISDSAAVLAETDAGVDANVSATIAVTANAVAAAKL